MGRVGELGGIQFRVLNRRKGPAVRGPRAQADRRLYAAAMQQPIRRHPNLTVIVGEADDVLAGEGTVAGVALGDGRVYAPEAVTLTPGTFLRGLIHIGNQSTPAEGRGGGPATGLA